MRLGATVRGRMSDSEGSVEESVRESGAREETVVAVANREDTGGDKLEEFEKLLRAMLPSRAASQEEEEPEENESERKIGAFLLGEHVFFPSLPIFAGCLMKFIWGYVSFFFFVRERKG